MCDTCGCEEHTHAKSYGKAVAPKKNPRGAEDTKRQRSGGRSQPGALERSSNCNVQHHGFTGGCGENRSHRRAPAPALLTLAAVEKIA